MSIGIKEQNLKIAQEIFSRAPRFHVDANFQLLMDAFPKDRAISFEEAVSICGRIGFVESQAWTDIWGEFFQQQHPEIVRNTANIGVLMEALMVLGVGEQDFLTSGTALQDLDQVLTHPEVRAQLAFTEESQRAAKDATERQAILAELAAVRTQIDGRGRKCCMDLATGRHLVIYKDEMEKLNSASLEELRQIKAGRDERARLRSLPIEELRKIARSATPGLSSRYEKLPTQYVPPGKDPVAGVPWSAALFSRLPNFERQRLLERYGNDQLTQAFTTRA